MRVGMVVHEGEEKGRWTKEMVVVSMCGSECECECECVGLWVL